MANTALVQIRTSEEDKQQASEILEKLGTNLSAVFNMMLKQIILTESIPFDISLHSANRDNRDIKAVAATMRLENMELENDDLEILRYYQNHPDEGNELRRIIMKELD